MINYLKKPLTITEIKERLEKSTTYITGTVAINFNEIIYNNNSQFINILSEKLTGGRALTNITYKAVGVVEAESIILIEVKGRAFNIISKSEDIDD